MINFWSSRSLCLLVNSTKIVFQKKVTESVCGAETLCNHVVKSPFAEREMIKFLVSKEYFVYK